MGYPMAHIPMSNASKLGKLFLDGVWVYPSGANVFGEDVAVRDYINFGADVLITLKEPWVFRNLPNTAINYVPIVPVDHTPISTAIVTNLTPAFKAIAISRFGEREMRQADVDNVEYIPHGSDSETFRSLDADAKKKCRALWGFPEEDDFTVVLVKMNRARGMIARQLRGYKRFLVNNPDIKSHLLLWTDVQPSSPENYEGAVSLGLADVGVNLLPEIFSLNLNKKVMHPSKEDYREGLVDWVGDDYAHGYDMVKLYNSADCLLYATGGEGFGLPLVEAQLCGLQVIATNYAAGPELVGAGELVEANDYEIMNTPGVRYALPSVDGIAEALEKICNSNREKQARRARAYAVKYDHKVVLEKYWKPFLDRCEVELRPLISKEGTKAW